MPFKEVNELRKNGQLDEALAMAVADVTADPTNIWNKRGLAWVYYELLKQTTDILRSDYFTQFLSPVNKIKLPGEEHLFWEQIAWQIGKMTFLMQKNLPGNMDYLNQCFTALREMPLPRPSESYSFVLKAFHRANKSWKQYIDFLDWWGLENLRPEDYLPEQMPDGKTTMALAEQVIVAYARILSETPENEERIKAFMPLLDRVIHNHPEYQYPPYYKGKLLLSLGDQENVLEAFLPFARKKQSEFWIWDLLSQTFPEGDIRKTACLSQALMCRADARFLGKVRLKLAEWFVVQQHFAEAKTEIEAIANIYTAEGWNLMPEAKAIQQLPWYQDTSGNTDNFPFYKQFRELAEEILFGELPEQVIVVDFVNTEREILSFVAEDGSHGTLKYKKRLRNVRIGDLFRVRMEKNSQNDQYKAYTIKSASSESGTDLKKSFEGTILIQIGRAFGFVDDLFIAPDWINKRHLTNGQLIKGDCIRSWHSKKNEIVWKVITLKSGLT